MRWQLCNLDIDGTIPAQKNLAARIETSIGLRALEDKLRLWPTGNSQSDIEAAIGKLPDKGPRLVFYGSGDLNQLSALLVNSVMKSHQPVNVVLFDNHPDWFNLPPKLHCGNWLGTLLNDKRIESATLVGQDSEDFKAHHFWSAPWKDLLNGRVEMYPYAMEHARARFGTDLKFKSICASGIEKIAERLRNKLQGKNVYIAIDKDVLRSEDARTDWEQGRLRLDELCYLLDVLCRNTSVVGADVCGERSPKPLRGFIKRLDAGRLFQNPAKDFDEATVINEKANLAIMNTIHQAKETACIS